MKIRYLIASAVAACVLTTGAYAATQSSIGVVDVKAVFANAKSVLADKTKLRAEFKSKHEKLVADKKSLDNLMAKYKRNQSVMNKSDKQKMQTQIVAQQTKIFHLSQLYAQQADQAQAKAMQTFVGELEVAAKKVAKAKHLTLVLPNTSVIYSSSTNDVTSAVEKAINA